MKVKQPEPGVLRPQTEHGRQGSSSTSYLQVAGWVILLLLLLAALALQLVPSQEDRLPVNMHSAMFADYSADPRGQLVQVVDMALAGEALRDRDQSQGGHSFATLQAGLQTLVPTVTGTPASFITNPATPTNLSPTALTSPSATAPALPPLTSTVSPTPAASPTPTILVTGTATPKPTFAVYPTSTQPPHVTNPPPKPTNPPQPTQQPPTSPPPTHAPRPTDPPPPPPPNPYPGPGPTAYP